MALANSLSAGLPSSLSTTSPSLIIREGPSPLTSDYIELALLVIFFVFGGPLNLAAWAQLNERPVATRLDLLKRHLNYSDLLVMFIYVPSRACWLMTYDWRGGNVLCKLVKYMHTLSFQGSANVIVCIALDRLLSVLIPARSAPERSVSQTRVMVVVAWIFAAVTSLPQLVFWEVLQAFPDYAQCGQIWQIRRWKISLGLLKSDLMNNTAAAAAANDAQTSSETLYLIGHITLVFYLPFIVISVCYFIIICYVVRSTRTPRGEGGALVVTAGGGGAAGGRLSGSSYTVSNHTVTTGAPATLMRAPQAKMPGGKLNSASNAAYDSTLMIPLAETVMNGGGNNHAAIKRPLIALPTVQEKQELAVPAVFPKIVISDENEQRVLLTAETAAVAADEPSPATRRSLLSRNSSSSTAAATTGCGGLPRSSLLRHRGTELIRVSFLLVAAYIICWMPYNGMMLWQFIDPSTFTDLSDHAYFLHELIIFNSLVNPFLYGMFANIRDSIRR